MPQHPKISLKKGREWHIRRGHPWLFSGGISQTPKRAEVGALVSLVDCDGKFVATGYYNPNCDIAVRVVSQKEDEEIDAELFVRRVRQAWELRNLAFDLNQTNVFRLINAEGDFLPGFIVDYFAGVVVIQSHTAGGDLLLPLLTQALQEVVKPKAIVIRNDASVRQREGLEKEEARIIQGVISEELLVKENGLVFQVDPIRGQKTGFFTDQRDKRLAVANYAKQLPSGGSMLNCFSYTCSFSVYAAEANKHLRSINVDQSQGALDIGKRNFEHNKLSADGHEFLNKDAFAFLEARIAAGTKYDIAILDPPAFAKSHKDKPKALKAYARMASLGAQVVKSGSLLVLCSCSGAISLEEFLETVRQSAGASGRSLQVLETFLHGADHPVNIMLPETSYLKVVFFRVLD